MNPHSSHPAKPSSGSLVWIPVALAVALSLDTSPSDPSIAVAIGLMSGGVLSILADPQGRGANRFFAGIGVLALVVTIGTELILRA